MQIVEEDTDSDDDDGVLGAMELDREQAEGKPCISWSSNTTVLVGGAPMLEQLLLVCYEQFLSGADSSFDYTQCSLLLSCCVL